jgi:hypothetical protein
VVEEDSDSYISGSDDGWAHSFPATLFIFMCTQINGTVDKTSAFISYSRPSSWNVSRGLYNVR